MKIPILISFSVLALPVLADLVSLPTPTPLHRIGFEIVVEAVAAAMAGGAIIRALVRKYRDLVSEDSRLACDMVGPDYVISDGKGKLRFVEEAEENDMRTRLEAGLPALSVEFEKTYVAQSRGWLCDSHCPCDGERTRWWNEKCEELVFEILLHNDVLRQQLQGVPMEWVMERLRREPRRRFGEWCRWALRERVGNFIVVNCYNWICDHLGGIWIKVPPETTSSTMRRVKMLSERRRWGERVALWFAYFLACYVVEAICLSLGVLPFCGLWWLLDVSLPFLLIGAGFLLRVCWALIDSRLALPAKRLYSNWKRERNARKREKLFGAYRGERRWSVPVPPSEQLADGMVIGTVGSAKDAVLRLQFPGVARHHAEIVFNKRCYWLGSTGYKIRCRCWNRIVEHGDGRLLKNEKSVYLNVGCEVEVGVFAVLKVISFADGVLEFALVDGKREVQRDKVVPGTPVAALVR